MYEQQFGPLVPRFGVASPPRAPGGSPAVVAHAPAGAPPEGQKQPEGQAAEPPGPHSIEDIYDQLKLPDEMLGGAFANVVMMRHTPEEFCFDFIASFYPRSVVSSRVYLAAGHVPSFIDALSGAFQKFQQRMRGGPPPQPPQQ